MSKMIPKPLPLTKEELKKRYEMEKKALELNNSYEKKALKAEAKMAKIKGDQESPLTPEEEAAMRQDYKQEKKKLKTMQELQKKLHETHYGLLKLQVKDDVPTPNANDGSGAA